VQLTGTHGSVRVFLPSSFLERSPKRERSLPAWMKTALSWRLTLRSGFVELDTAELEAVEPGDVLLYTFSAELVLPGRGSTPERGWIIAQDHANARKYSIESFQEWSYAMPSEEREGEVRQETDRPDLAALPVRVHVVLGYVDLSLKELEALSEGSIVELSGESQGSVQLVAGGAVLGTGELVELEDRRLGVQVTRWREQ